MDDMGNWIVKDTETGESQSLFEFLEENIDEIPHDVHVEKLSDMLLGSGNKTLMIVSFFIRNKKNDNTISVTHEEMSNDLGISSKTVDRAIRRLIHSEFIARIGKMKYMVNPKVIYNAQYDHQKLVSKWSQII